MVDEQIKVLQKLKQLSAREIKSAPDLATRATGPRRVDDQGGGCDEAKSGKTP